MSQPYTNVALVVQAAIVNGAHSATKFVSPKHVIKVTQRLCAHKLPRKDGNRDMVVTMGSPNYADRLFIKDCLKAGEPFPIKKIKLKFPPKKIGTRKGEYRVARKGVRSLAAKVLGQTRARARG